MSGLVYGLLPNETIVGLTGTLVFKSIPLRDLDDSLVVKERRMYLELLVGYNSPYSRLYI